MINSVLITLGIIAGNTGIFGVQNPLELFKAYFTQYAPKKNSAIVQINTARGASGTAFFINLNGKKVAVTAAHVCGDQAALFSSKGMHEVLLSVPERDTCVLSTYQNVDTLDLGDDPKQGQAVSTTGFPLRLQWDYREGKAHDVGLAQFLLPPNYYGEWAGFGRDCPKTGIRVSRGDQQGCVMGVTTTEIEMMVRPGNSGGPLMDSANRVTGIVIGSNGANIGYAIPVSEVRQVLERLGSK